MESESDSDDRIIANEVQSVSIEEMLTIFAVKSPHIFNKLHR